MPLGKHKENVEEFRKPRNIKELQSFLGCAGWYRTFISNYSLKTSKLTDGLRKRKNFEWTDEMNVEFENI